MLTGAKIDHLAGDWFKITGPVGIWKNFDESDMPAVETGLLVSGSGSSDAGG